MAILNIRNCKQGIKSYFPPLPPKKSSVLMSNAVYINRYKPYK